MKRPGPRSVLAFGIVAGLASGVALAEANPAQVGLATDVYYRAARAFLTGSDVYGVHPAAHPGYRFLYPPVVVLAFLPHALTGSPAGAYALQTAITLATAGALAVVLVRETERAGADLDRIDRGLIAGYAVGSYGATATLVMGQVNLQLALAVAAGTRWLERGRARRSGAAFGVAALVKPYLAVTGAWLLRRRAWRAVAAATATGIGGLLAGVVLVGRDPTLTYLFDVLPREAATGSFAGVPAATSPYVTIRRQVAFLAPDLPPAVRSGVAALLLVPVVLACQRSTATDRDRLVGLGGTLLALLAFVPLEPFYVGLVIFPVVPLLYLLDGVPQGLLLAGVALLSAPVTMESVRIWASVLPGGAGRALLDVARTAFRFALPPAYGIWLALAGLVLDQVDRPRRDGSRG